MYSDVQLCCNTFLPIVCDFRLKMHRIVEMFDNYVEQQHLLFRNMKLYELPGVLYSGRLVKYLRLYTSK